MYLRQLTEQQYDRFCNDLAARAAISPLDPSYAVTLVINQAEYQVKLQPERHNTIAVLHALRVCREPDGPSYDLITQNAVLTALLELLLYQGIPA